MTGLGRIGQSGDRQKFYRSISSPFHHSTIQTIPHFVIHPTIPLSLHHYIIIHLIPHITIPSNHHIINPTFHNCIKPLFHHSVIIWVHHSIVPSFHHSIVLIVHHFIDCPSLDQLKMTKTSLISMPTRPTTTVGQAYLFRPPFRMGLLPYCHNTIQETATTVIRLFY